MKSIYEVINLAGGMNRAMKKTGKLLTFVLLLSGITVTANAAESKKYLFYEDFNYIESGSLPDDFVIETGTPASIERTTVDEENGDYAIKLTSGSSGYAVGMRLSEAIAGREDSNDKITIEFDLKNEYGGFGLSWLTSEEIASGSQYILNKNILNLGNWSPSKRRAYFGAATTNTAYWGAPFASHGYNDEGMITGNGEFTSFGKWIHVTMTLDGQSIVNNDDGTPKYQNKFMNATVSWYEKDTPNVTYTVSKNGSGFQIEGAAGTENHFTQNLGNIRQRDIASVVIPVAAASGVSIPTMEIDNLVIYLTSTTVQAPVTENVSFEQANGGMNINVNFSERMRKHTLSHIKLECDGEDVKINPKMSSDGRYSIIENAVTKEGVYNVIVNSGATSYSGGMMTEPFSFEFECGAGEDGSINLLPIILGAEAELYDGTTTTVLDGVSPYIKTFTIRFSNPMAENLKDYINVSGNLTWNGSFSEDKTRYTIVFENICANAEYSVTVPAGTPSEDGIGTKETKSFNITTKNDVGIAFTPIKLVSGNEEVSALPPPGTICKLSSEIIKTSTAEQKAIIMVCQYKLTDGYERLEAVKFVPLYAKDGASRDAAELEFTVAEGIDSIKVYIRDYPSHNIIEKIIYE